VILSGNRLKGCVGASHELVPKYRALWLGSDLCTCYGSGIKRVGYGNW